MGEECCFGFGGVNLQIPPLRPVNTHFVAGFWFLEDVVNFVPCCHPSDFPLQGKAFGSGDALHNPFYERWCVSFKEDRRHWWALWYTWFHRVSLHVITLDYHFDNSVCEKPCHPSCEVSVHPLAFHCVDQAPTAYTWERYLDVHQEYASSVACSPGCVCSGNHDCSRADCRPPFSAPVLAITNQSSSLSLFRQ